MAELQINGTNIPDPRTIEYMLGDVDYESGRDQSGTMYRDRVAVKRKISCTWSGLDESKMATLLQAMQSAKFTITYHDPQTNASRTMNAYVGDRTMPLYSVRTVNGNKVRVYESLSANFVEY